jgi:hypothetical protein
MGNPRDPKRILVDFSELVCSLWSKSFEEGYYAPIWYLASLISFTLQLETISIAPSLIGFLLPIAQASISLLAQSRHLAVKPDYEAETLAAHIDSTHILSLLYLTALACAAPTLLEPGKPSAQTEFWWFMTLDFVTILLTPKQLFDDVVGTLKLLRTSVTPGSIGPISGGDIEPQVVARIVIDKVSALLVETPRSATSNRQRHELCLAALETLTSFLHSPFGASQVALHANAIPRLVTIFSRSLDELYDMGTSEVTSREPRDVACEDDTALADLDQDIPAVYKLISQSLFLLHTLVTDPRTADAVDMNVKLLAAHGGPQRYNVALARVTFAGDLVYEEGIPMETVELAHELLEVAITPDDGEAIGEIFGAEED